MSPNRTFLLPTAGLLLAAGAGLFLLPITSRSAGTTRVPETSQVPASDKATAPFGEFAEIHSCELYTGGCTASAEATLEGRYMLRVWKFAGGYSSGGDPMKGLSVALLEKGSENIAMPENVAHQAVAYLPEGATAAQRDALLRWVRSQTAVKVDARADVREVPLKVNIWEGTAQVSAGKDIAFTSRMPDPCGPASCGERLWYEPRNAAATFMVGQVTSASIVEPAMSLSWKDQGRRAVFTGQFGPMAGRVPAFCGAGSSAGANRL